VCVWVGGVYVHVIACVCVLVCVLVTGVCSLLLTLTYNIPEATCEVIRSVPRLVNQDH